MSFCFTINMTKGEILPVVMQLSSSSSGPSSSSPERETAALNSDGTPWLLSSPSPSADLCSVFQCLSSFSASHPSSSSSSSHSDPSSFSPPCVSWKTPETHRKLLSQLIFTLTEETKEKQSEFIFTQFIHGGVFQADSLYLAAMSRLRIMK